MWNTLIRVPALENKRCSNCPRVLSRTDRHRLCQSCRVAKVRLEAYEAGLARGRFEMMNGEDRDALRPLWRDLQRLVHPDLHEGSLERRALANAVTTELNRLYA